ncbi:MAG: type II secretion system protein N [Burkholderiaceae bacterium]
MKRLPVFVSFVLFIALCVSGTYWATRLFKRTERPVSAPQQIARVEVNLGAAAALFGGRPASAAVASNFQLKGVVVADKAEESVAILSADGKPPQSIALNAEVMPGVTVKEVHAKYVVLSDGGVNKRVELPESGQQLRMESAANDSATQATTTPMTMAPMTAAPPTTLPPPPQGGNPNPNAPLNMLPRVPGG